MSLKPKKFSELKIQQDELQKKCKRRKKKTNIVLPPYTYIVSEGTKTEPYYIEAMAQVINENIESFQRASLW